MKKICFTIIPAVLISFIFLLPISAEGPPEYSKKVLDANYQISGPYVHDNLSVFLIHGKNQIENKTYMTLDEAFEKKKVVLHETGDVNQLSIENKSDSHDLFIQSGDIVKGGKQDRVIGQDTIIPPRSGLKHNRK